MTVVESISRARRQKKISIAEVARRSGLRASNISAIENGSREPTARNLERAARGAGMRLIVADLDGRTPVSEIADAIAAMSADDGWSRARLVTQLSNDLVAADPFVKMLMAAERPRRIAPEWDSAIAGVVEWRLAEARLPSPSWVGEVGGDERRRWSIWPGPVLADESDVPEPLRRRGVWVSADELEAA